MRAYHLRSSSRVGATAARGGGGGRTPRARRGHRVRPFFLTPRSRDFPGADGARRRRSLILPLRLESALPPSRDSLGGTCAAGQEFPRAPDPDCVPVRRRRRNRRSQDLRGRPRRRRRPTPQEARRGPGRERHRSPASRPTSSSSRSAGKSEAIMDLKELEGEKVGDRIEAVVDQGRRRTSGSSRKLAVGHRTKAELRAASEAKIPVAGKVIVAQQGRLRRHDRRRARPPRLLPGLADRPRPPRRGRASRSSSARRSTSGSSSTPRTAAASSSRASRSSRKSRTSKAAETREKIVARRRHDGQRPLPHRLRRVRGPRRRGRARPRHGDLAPPRRAPEGRPHGRPGSHRQGHEARGRGQAHLAFDEGARGRSLGRRSPERFAPGASFTGTVARHADFGLFVEVEPGVDGLVHVSALPPGVSLKDPPVAVGQTVQGWVKEVDPKHRRLSLSLREVATSDPWAGIKERHPEGSVVKGEVESVAAFGVFVRLEPGLTGLIPNSETGVPPGTVVKHFRLGPEGRGEGHRPRHRAEAHLALGGRREGRSRPRRAPEATARSPPSARRRRRRPSRSSAPRSSRRSRTRRASRRSRLGSGVLSHRPRVPSTSGG